MSVELDTGACWIRHVSRAAAGAAGAVSVIGAAYVAQPLEGVNGRQGWQSAQPEVRLSDDGSFSVRFPNAVGDDGRLHRDRFAIVTDPLYRPGEEWLEFWREPEDLIMVGTPTRAKLDRGELVLEGLDAMVLGRNALSSESDVWVGADPLDVIAFYAGVPVLQAAVDFTGWTPGGSTAGTGWTDPDPSSPTYGWRFSGGVSADPAGDGVLCPGAGAVVVETPQPGMPSGGLPAGSRDWILEARWRHVSQPDPSSYIRMDTGNVSVQPRSDTLSYMGGSGVLSWSVGVAAVGSPKVTYGVPGAAVHRLIARGEWLYFYVNGELVVRARRHPTNADTPGRVILGVGADATKTPATAVLQSVRYLTVEPLLMRTMPDDRRLPGTPPPGGLRARYYLENDARMNAKKYSGGPRLGADAPEAFRFLALDPLAEPYAERLEAPAFAGANPPAWMPPGPPSGEAFSARWTGAVYFDLAASDRALSVDGGTETYGRIRVWIGGRFVLDYSAQEPNPSPGRVFQTTLRQYLGQRAGWWPILVEYSHLTGAGGFGLYDQAGAYNTATRVAIPATRLSPLGTVDQEVRNAGHRETLGNIAESFGYQWRLEPRSLESGEFPGELGIGPRVGRDTAHVIDSLDAHDIATEVDAGDAVDGLLVDASGLASITEGAQLSAEAFTVAARDHLMYSAGYESLAEISEAPLLRGRTESLLALRSSPAENVGVRVKGTRELVDAFPLPLTPALARMLWQPGDGLRLELAELGVRDETPRQLTVVQWPLRPDGAAPPVVSFRQRGRGMRAALERISRAAYASRRSYQGQLAVVNGSVGASPAVANVGDTASRLNLPPDRKVVSIDLVVQSATAGTRTLWIHGVATPLVLTRAGRVNLSAYAAPDPTQPTRMWVELRDAATPTGGAWSYALEAVVVI